MDAWDRSFRSALIKGLRDNWWLKALSIFSPDYFWLRQITLRFVIDYFHGSFEKHGLDVYRAHYRQLEDVLGGRNHLEWTVEDGWYIILPLSLLSKFYGCVSEKPSLTLIMVKGNPCAPSLANRYQTSLFQAVMHPQHSCSGLQRRENPSTDRRVSIWLRHWVWWWQRLLQCGWHVRGFLDQPYGIPRGFVSQSC